MTVGVFASVSPTFDKVWEHKDITGLTYSIAVTKSLLKSK